jgi:excinuclease UvrABC helicase subunit UvrB
MSNKRIRKLTPQLIKKLIAEEKQKIADSKKRQARKKKNLSEAKVKKIKKQIKVLNETKEMQRELVLKFKKLYQLRQKIKNNLIKRV